MPALELLAPAKNVLMARTAINHGADAVYMGCSAFGARQNACNTLSSFEEVVQYAHQYHVKVYATLNTILYDNELEQARKLAYDLYNIGADALIIQDTALLNTDMPPIALHASTQMHNTDADKIKHYRQWGISRVILARELSLEQIQHIKSTCGIDVECFVHGSLCVCYSGQCYMSHYIGDRSANRGVCAQPCRLEYDITDKNHKPLLPSAHYLSLKDMCRLPYLAAMAAAGITSFKIEGRLKDEYYVANVVSAYRQQLDSIIDSSQGAYTHASLGKVYFDFIPDVEKTFNRGYTDYYLQGERTCIGHNLSPKSMGKYLGTADMVSYEKFHIDTPMTIANGDGLCWVNNMGRLEGMSVNSVQNNEVRITKDINISKGTPIYRNYDNNFTTLLKKENTTRKIRARIAVQAVNNMWQLLLTDEAGYTSRLDVPLDYEEAKNVDMARNNIAVQMSKAGNSVFNVEQVDVQVTKLYFIPASSLNAMRRTLLDKHTQLLMHNMPTYTSPPVQVEPLNVAVADYKANVSNHLAREFYEKHGVKVMEPAVECSRESENKELMRTKYCIRYELGACLKTPYAHKLPPELYLQYDQYVFALHFDCQRCEMTITACDS